MAKPNRYTLGSTNEIIFVTRDTNGSAVTPDEARLTINVPDGTQITVSGGAMTEGDGYLSYLYTPTVSGWYIYEGWIKDDFGREGANADGFDVTNRIIP